MNNYKRDFGLYNGSKGFVVSCDKKLIVDFDGVHIEVASTYPRSFRTSGT